MIPLNLELCEVNLESIFKHLNKVFRRSDLIPTVIQIKRFSGVEVNITKVVCQGIVGERCYSLVMHRLF